MQLGLSSKRGSLAWTQWERLGFHLFLNTNNLLFSATFSRLSSMIFKTLAHTTNCASGSYFSLCTTFWYAPKLTMNWTWINWVIISQEPKVYLRRIRDGNHITLWLEIWEEFNVTAFQGKVIYGGFGVLAISASKRKLYLHNKILIVN